MSSITEVPSYPVDKNVYGNSAWKILHTAASQMPEIPKKSDKIQFRQFLARMLHYFPCDECKLSARDHIKTNPPKMRNKVELQEWLCDLHNKENEKLGKPTIPCRTMISNSVVARKGAECVSCKISNYEKGKDDKSTPEQPDLPGIGEKSRVSVGVTSVIKPTHSHPHPVSSEKYSGHYRNLKKASEKVLISLLQKHGIPNPEVYHESCPEKIDTSCTHFPVDSKGLLVNSVPTKVYLDPNVSSPRTIAHEAIHIIKKYRGKEHPDGSINEEEVEKEAREIIEKEFPKGNSRPKEPTVIEYDKKRQTIQTINERANKRLAEYKQNLPTFAAHFKASSTKPRKKAEPQPQIPSPFYQSPGGYAPAPIVTLEEPQKPEGESKFSEGILNMLDPIYRPFADMLGLEPWDVNLAHTPIILSQIGVTATEANLNLFGSTVISVIAATTTLLAGTLAKDSLGLGDRKFLVNVGANFLWNPMTYVGVKKYREEVIENAKDFGSALSSGDINEILESLKPTDKQKKTVEIKQAMTAQAQAVIKKRAMAAGDTGQTQNLLKGGSPKPFRLQSLSPSASPSAGGISGAVGGRTYEVDTSKRRYKTQTEEDVLEDGESMIDLDPFSPAIA